jgi:hypothetical protein
MFIEALESRTLLSATDLSLRVFSPPTSPSTLLVQRVFPNDLLFDANRNQLLIKDYANGISRYDAATGQYVGLIPTVVYGADISPDGNTLYAVRGTEGIRISLVDESATIFPITTPSESRWFTELAIGNNRATISEWGSPSQTHYLRTIDLLTNDVSAFYLHDTFPAAESLFLARSADYQHTFMVSNKYDYEAGGTGRDDRSFGDLYNLAVSRDGALHAISTIDGLFIVNSSFDIAVKFNFSRAGTAFDPVRDVLYVADPATDQIFGISTTNWSTLFALPIGEDMVQAFSRGVGNMVLNADGSALYLLTNSGVRAFQTNGTYGNSLLLTAAISSPDGNPTGSVTFTDSATNTVLGEAPIVAGAATLAVNSLHAGSHSIVAHYQGDANFDPSDSEASTLIVNPAITTARITSDAQGTALVTLSSPAGAPDSGTVSLYDGDTLVDSVQLHSPTTSFNFTLPAGVHSLKAVYSGSGDFLAATSATLRHVIRTPTTLSISSSSDTSAPGEIFTLTIRLSPYLSAGSPVASIFQDDQLVATGSFNSDGIIRVTRNLSSGTHSFYATFGGSELLAPATSDQIIHTTITRTATISFTGPAQGRHDAVSLSVTLHDTTGTVIPKGQIIYKENGTVLATSEVTSNGVSSFLASLSAGTHTLAATYISSNGFAEVTSDPLTIQVLRSAAAIKLTSSPKWIPQTQIVHLTAKLANFSDSGQIIFKDGKRNLGSAPIVDGSADLDRTLRAGVHSITASFAGSSNYLPAVSKALSVTVVPATAIDLIVLYTPAATRSIGSADAMRDLITDSVADTNLAFQNSHIPVVIRLVHSRQIVYAESGKFHTDLQRLLIPNDGYMDSAHKLRNTYGADLVSLFESDGDLGGASYELSDLRDKTNPDFAFSVVRAAQADGPSFSLAHELGHNLGATHDDQHRQGKGATTFSNGWRFRGKDGRLYHDIMSYDPGKTIPYFSNPRIKYAGVPTGNAKTADSARTITLAAPYVAAYRRARGT